MTRLKYLIDKGVLVDVNPDDFQEFLKKSVLVYQLVVVADLL